MGTANERDYVIPSRYWSWMVHRRAISAVIWFIALSTAAEHLRDGRVWLANTPETPEHDRRPDSGGQGYTQIDFGGQWVMGRMLVEGHGRELYHRQRQWEVVRTGYPVAAETPAQREEAILPRHQRKLLKSDDEQGHDADRMMYWFMGRDPGEWKTLGGAASTPLAVELTGNPFAAFVRTQAAADATTPRLVEELNKPAVGGPLYPPVHAFIYAPLGLFSNPQDAFYLFQFLAIGFSLLAGLGISVLAGGRIWWSLATAAVLLYPGCRYSISLAQNPTVSLCIVVWGWVVATRRRDWAAGAVWGLFAFKPVWGMAFFLVPLVMGRWRICVSMVLTGAGLAALTLPFVGLQSWFDWLNVGSEAADLYNRSQSWINLSRDLQGIPRRFLHDFTLPLSERETPKAKAVAWSLWGLVFAGTVLIYRLRADRTKTVGLGAAFLFLGAWLTCYRFMYYDVLLSIIGFACLFVEPKLALRGKVFGLNFAPQSVEDSPSITPTETPATPLGPKTLGYMNSLPLTVLFGMILLDNVLAGMNIEATIGVVSWGRPTTASDGSTAMSSPRVRADSTMTYPWETFLMLLFWAWCGWRLLRGEERKRDG